jgi:hypothetical protein
MSAWLFECCASQDGICSGDASAQYARIAPVFDFIQMNFGLFRARCEALLLCAARKGATLARRDFRARLFGHEDEQRLRSRCPARFAVGRM